MRSVRSAAVAALSTIAVVVAGTAACGIPADDGPEALPLPPEITSAGTSTPPPPAAASGELTATICLTRNEFLVPVSRPFETAPSPEDLLADLVEGATKAEQEQGLSSSVRGIQTLSVGIDARVADVEVGDGLEDFTGTTLLLIVGQIVCTLDAHPDIDGVVFSRDGRRQSVPKGDVTQTEEMVTANDYLERHEPTASPASPT